MLKISKLSDYATVLMAKMCAQPEAKTAALWAEQTRLPKTTIAKVLKLLARAELVRATRGASGGYQLAKNAQQISLVDILQAIDGPLGLTDCSPGNPSNCVRSGFCTTRSHWNVINEVIISALRSVSLEDLNQPFGKRPAITASMFADPTHTVSEAA